MQSQPPQVFFLNDHSRERNNYEKNYFIKIHHAVYNGTSSSPIPSFPVAAYWRSEKRGKTKRNKVILIVLHMVGSPTFTASSSVLFCNK